MEFNYKKENKDFNKRRQDYERAKQKYPDKIPIICEKDSKVKMKDFVKTKFLAPLNSTVFELFEQIRKINDIKKEEALFFLINGKHSINQNCNISEIYKKYHDEDGFLYIAYSKEIIWGSN